MFDYSEMTFSWFDKKQTNLSYRKQDWAGFWENRLPILLVYDLWCIWCGQARNYYAT